MRQRLPQEEIINRSGFEIRRDAEILPLRSGYYTVVRNQSVAGDAPKDFIRVYEYGRGKRGNPGRWPAFIAKVGHKWYPNESVTEHFLTRVGQLLGLNMADSRLMSAHGQIRFLSRYFLKRDQSLVHGAEVFAGYLEDNAFVEEVEQAGATREMFTFQFVEEALLARFPSQASSILQDYTRMLAFDAVVGNNDRHHYNWGVIVHALGTHEPRFAPVYDSARALFWNDPESNLQAVRDDPNLQREPAFLKRYVRKSQPKTGWEGLKRPNHYDLIQGIHETYPALRPVLEDLYQPDLIERVRSVLHAEFRDLMSPLRREIILACLALRLERYRLALAP